MTNVKYATLWQSSKTACHHIPEITWIFVPSTQKWATVLTMEAVCSCSMSNAETELYVSQSMAQ